LAQTFSRLSDANWEQVALYTIISDEIAPYKDDGNVQIEGPDVELNPKQAISLSLALHELVTNAAKYGALSVRGGAVKVSWSILGSEQRVRLEWTETGGPEVREPDRKGLGRVLLETATPSDLNGSVQLFFYKEGLICIINFPIEASGAAAAVFNVARQFQRKREAPLLNANPVTWAKRRESAC